MENKTKQFKIWIITALILLFESIPCSVVSQEITDTKNFTNLVVFTKFSDEEEFINNTYAGTTVRNILENTYNKSMYGAADYFKTVSGGKMNMQTLYLLDSGNSITLSQPRGYYFKKSDQNPYGYDYGEESYRAYELQTEWTDAISNVIAKGNKPEDINGNKYNFADLDLNRDGKIDLITVIYKNTVQDFDITWSDPLWDYESYTDRISVQEGNKTYQSGEYVQLTGNYKYLYRGADNLPVLPTGKICHETMHALGLKDLYDSKQAGKVYFMSLMAKRPSHVGQYITVKERESLGWLDEKQIKRINKNGRYILSAASAREGTVAYKRDLPNGKTLYLEYRRFDKFGNKYDNQNKDFYSCETGELMKGITIKSGLICYLAATDIRFPSNLNPSDKNGDMEVVSHGQYSTMTDCAVGDGEFIYIDTGNGEICIDMTKMTDGELEFEISGLAENDPQIDCSIKDENLSVTLRNSTSGGIVLAAEFDANGIFRRLTSRSPQAEMTIPLLPETNTAKVMWWDSLSGMTPLAEIKTARR